MSIERPLKVTKTVYTVLDFIEWQRANTLELRPYFQRGSVWTSKAKSYFIDSLLRGYPVPIIFLQNKTDSTTLRNIRQVVDGQQRLRTLLAYVDISTLRDATADDDVRIMRSHNRDLASVSFPELPQELRDRLTSTELSVHVLPSKVDDRELLQLFARLNSTGERLNDQELRNAEYHGFFKSSAYELAYEQLDRWRGWGLFNTRQLAQMREVEFTSDLIVILLRGIFARTKTFLDQVYDDYDDEFPYADAVQARFLHVMNLLDKLYQPDSRHGGLGALQSQSWTYTLFAAMAQIEFDSPLEGSPFDKSLSSTLRGLKFSHLLEAARKVQTRLQTGDVPDRVARALRGASTDRSSRLARLDFLVEAI